MGAALTYARRYALFTLVGIAGEDDLDAPDLAGNQLNSGILGSSSPEKTNGHADAATADRVRSSERAGKIQTTKAPTELLPEQSAATRDRLLAEVSGLVSADAAASWARKGIKAKNGLGRSDGKLVEDAFAARLSELQPDGAGVPPADEVAPPASVALDAGSERVRMHFEKLTQRCSFWNLLPPEPSRTWGRPRAGRNTKIHALGDAKGHLIAIPPEVKHMFVPLPSG
jgi:hypothetical protein